jgi:hypothetical protein
VVPRSIPMTFDISSAPQMGLIPAPNKINMMRASTRLC